MLEGSEPYSFLTRARGASKTTDLAAVALALLLDADDAARLYWVAADSDQGKLAIDSIAGLRRSYAEPRRSRRRFRRAACSRPRPARRSTCSLPTLRELGGCALLRCSADELANWADTTHPRRVWEAVSSAVAKSPDARLVVLTTAGDPAHFSAKILEHAARVAAVARPRGSRSRSVDGSPIASPSSARV